MTMKRIACEMCGNPDLIKQDGVFVCQFCGCKYSAEEVKKMIVDISGSTVKVDTSGELANLYQLARRARNTNNRVDAKRYYDMILLKDPTSWEAAFYFAYFSSALNIKLSLNGVFTLVQEHVSPEEQPTVIEEIVSSMVDMAKQSPCDNTIQLLYLCGVEIFKHHYVDSSEITKSAIRAWKTGVTRHISLCSPGFYLDSQGQKQVSAFVERIKEYDQEFFSAFVAHQDRTHGIRQTREEIEKLKTRRHELEEVRKKACNKLFHFIVSGLLTLLVALNNGIMFLSIIAAILLFVALCKIAVLTYTNSQINLNNEEQLAKEEKVRCLTADACALRDKMGLLSKA